MVRRPQEEIMEAPKKPLYKSLYFQVICSILLGIALGHFYPQTAQAMKPLGDGFIKLIKMIIAPIIFCTVVLGVAGMEDMKKLGRIGGKALIYFEAVTTLALIIGLVVVNTLQPRLSATVWPTGSIPGVCPFAPLSLKCPSAHGRNCNDGGECAQKCLIPPWEKRHKHGYCD